MKRLDNTNPIILGLSATKIIAATPLSPPTKPTPKDRCRRGPAAHSGLSSQLGPTSPGAEGAEVAALWQLQKARCSRGMIAIMCVLCSCGYGQDKYR